MNVEAGKRDRAVVFATDATYLAPTLVAAIQVAQQSIHIADVYLAMIGEPGVEHELAPFFSMHNLHVIRVPEVVIPADVQFNHTHVSRSTLARFSLARALPDHVEHMIYLDGDIQICDDITPLLRHTVKPGYLAAANDKYWLGNFARSKSHKAYLEGIGASAQTYFNAGVLACRRQTWQEVSAAALRYFMANSSLCKFHDQSALNAILGDRREILNPLYNFISDYTYLRGLRGEKPKIIHFTGHLKPWIYKDLTSNSRFSPSYDAIYEALPLLKQHRVAALSDAIKAAKKSERIKQLIFDVTLISAIRGARFKDYVGSGGFAFTSG